MFTREKQEMKRVPMMPVRDMVIFPQQMTPFIVGREASVRALEEALAGDKKIFLSTQHDASVDDPKPEEIYAVGTLANIVQSVKLPDGNIKVLVEGVQRARALSIATEEGFFRATIRLLGQRVEDSPQVKQLVEKVTGLYEQFIKLSQSLNYDTMIAAARGDDPSRLSDTIAANLQLPVDEKQDLLETVDPLERLNRIGEILEIELEKLNVDRNINTRVKRQMERAQKEYYLNEKLKAIQKELGRGEKSETDELKKKIDAAGMPKDVHEKAIQELKRLELMPPMSAESTVSRNYLDWLIAVPWKKRSKEIRDIKAAEKVLNEEHYGLEKIKDRILEFLAVRQLVKNPKGSILCFVGPPGVGKTSLAMSIGHATGRKFVRVSLGGVRDEAEIRGHRRTYIGALPGKIIQSMKKAGSSNPVFLMDEIDKMSTDFRGDPSSALLEVLDPEQNTTFNDHYLDLERFRYGRAEAEHKIGVATGLAWTERGGELLATEVTIMPGKGQLTITGKLGDVMQESAQAAMSYVRSRAMELGLERDFYQKIDVHIHVPEGAIPKDGPSAGITMATSLVSALIKVPVYNDLAMTGEITLRGTVLPIGGLKEKVLAAHRAGIKKVLIPADNEKDIEEIPATVLKTVEMIAVSHMDEVLKKALVIDDPDALFKGLAASADAKEENPPFGDKVEDAPGPDILPQ